MQLVRLHQSFGISPHDALFVRPAWEIDLFIRALPPLEGDEEPRSRGPARVPADLKDLPV